MSITINRPLDNWYYETDDSPWWRIDYPPIAAYLSFLFGYIYRFIEPQAMNLQMGYESHSLKSYMRFTALLVDFALLVPGILLIFKSTKHRLGNLFLLVLLIKPDVILIDHGHFQYNSLILGLIALAFYYLLTGRYYLCCLLYTIAIHAKQMAVYYSLAFLAALIGLTVQDNIFRKKYIIIEITKYACIVIAVSLLIWMPWLSSIDDF
jgi:alpha-1,3-glucosyltransferase